MSNPDAPLAVSPTPSGRLLVRMSTTSGTVVVTADDGPDVIVEKGGQLVHRGPDLVEIRPERPSSSLRVRCPAACDVMVGTTSGGVELQGVLGAVSVTSASGSIRVGHVVEADLRTASGSVHVEECTSGCRVATKSGSITVDWTGTANVSAVSGTVRVHRVDRDVEARTVSGGLTIGSRAGGPVRARTVSGNIHVHLPAGVRPSVRASSPRPVKGGCEEGDDVVIEVGTVSGSVEITAP